MQKVGSTGAIWLKKMSETCKNHVQIRLPCLHQPFNHGMNEVIDVRTPEEYCEDHIPGAINLPVLTNDERHQVGSEYADNSFMARRMGASLISNNIGAIIRKHFFDKPKNYSCMIYCWRGGQRSKSIAMVLTLIGYDVKFLSGGYKTYRKEVMSQLSEIPSKFNYNVIGGMTGCGKTLLLDQLRKAGEQVLDLEGLANHKGSVLGITSEDEAQPSTKMFESRLLQQFHTFDPSLPVWVESEGRVIGNLQIPNCVFRHIESNILNLYTLQAPFPSRVMYLLSEYSYWTDNPLELKRNLERLSHLNVPLKKWFRLIDENRFKEFVENILENHYDPSYRKSAGKTFARLNASNEEIINLEQVTTEFLNTVMKKLLEDNNNSVRHSIHN